MFNMPASSRQHRPFQGWKWMTIGLMTLYCVATCVNATVVCSDCRPLDLQEAPAVGLSLAPGYGAASVQFVNGTTSDVVLVHGGEEYLQAMIRWQQLENTVCSTTSHSSLSRTPVMSADGSILCSYQTLLRSWMRTARQAFVGDHRSPECSSDDLDDILEPIADMVITLFRYTKESIPLKYNKIFLAGPDFGTTTTRSLSLQIQPLLREAGLETFGKHYRRQSQAALLNLYGLEDCHGIPVDENTEVPDKECEAYDGRSIQSVFLVAVDGFSLTLRSLIREDGMFYPHRGAVELLWKDEQIEDEDGYFAWVDRALRKFLGTQHVAFDLLLLSGTKAKAPELQDIIQDVLKENDNIRPEDYLRSEQDHAFAAARGATALARLGMCNGFDACLPTLRCPVSAHCSKWAWQRGDAEDRKREL